MVRYPGFKKVKWRNLQAPTPNVDFSYYKNSAIPRAGFLCPQLHTAGRPTAEECLYLDIYVPPTPLPSKAKPCVKFPVMFFVHGGGYKCASLLFLSIVSCDVRFRETFLQLVEKICIKVLICPMFWRPLWLYRTTGTVHLFFAPCEVTWYFLPGYYLLLGWAYSVR